MNNKIFVLQTKSIERDYPKEVYELLYETESKHFWFEGRNRIIGSFIRDVLKQPKEVNFLEVGCGTGYVLSYLESLGYKMTGLDMHLAGLRFARKRSKSVKLVCSDIRNKKFKGKFDAIGLFDVIEHISDHERLLNDCAKRLKSDGYLFITVPADMKLWSAIDEISGHKRRYTIPQIQSILAKLGFSVIKISYFNTLLYPTQFLFRKSLGVRNRNIIKDTTLQLKESFDSNSLLNILGKISLYVESVLLKKLSFPYGASIIATARKKK